MYIDFAQHDLTLFSAHSEERHGCFWVSWNGIAYCIAYYYFAIKSFSCWIFDEHVAFSEPSLHTWTQIVERFVCDLPRRTTWNSRVVSREWNPGNSWAMESPDGGCVSLPTGDGVLDNDSFPAGTSSSQFDDTGTTCSLYMYSLGGIGNSGRGRSLSPFCLRAWLCA